MWLYFPSSHRDGSVQFAVGTSLAYLLISVAMVINLYYQNLIRDERHTIHKQFRDSHKWDTRTDKMIPFDTALGKCSWYPGVTLSPGLGAVIVTKLRVFCSLARAADALPQPCIGLIRFPRFPLWTIWRLIEVTPSMRLFDDDKQTDSYTGFE